MSTLYNSSISLSRSVADPGDVVAVTVAVRYGQNPASTQVELLMKVGEGGWLSLGEKTSDAINGLAVWDVPIQGEPGSRVYFYAVTYAGPTQTGQVSVLIIEEPRETLRTILGGITVPKDDGTDANVKVEDAFDRELIDNCDLVVWLELVEETEQILDKVGTRLVRTKYNVGLTARDRAGVTAKKILWRAEVKLKEVLGAVQESPGGNIKRIYPGGLAGRIVDRTSVPPIVTQKYWFMTERIGGKGEP